MRPLDGDHDTQKHPGPPLHREAGSGRGSEARHQGLPTANGPQQKSMFSGLRLAWCVLKQNVSLINLKWQMWIRFPICVVYSLQPNWVFANVLERRRTSSWKLPCSCVWTDRAQFSAERRVRRGGWELRPRLRSGSNLIWEVLPYAPPERYLPSGRRTLFPFILHTWSQPTAFISCILFMELSLVQMSW